MTKNLISICIPTYKRLDYLYNLIQTIPEEIEIIISDNGNFITNEFGEYKNVKVCHTDRILPMFSNWNNAIKNTTSKWFIIPGDDDLFHKDTFNNINLFLEKYNDAGMVIFGHDIINDKLEITKGWKPTEEEYILPPFGLLKFQKGVDARVPSIIFNTDRFKEQGMFDERFKFTAADSFIIQRLSLVYPTVFIPQVLGIYRVWENNFTNTKIYTKEWFDQVALWLFEITDLIKQYGKQLHIDKKSFTSFIYMSNIKYGFYIMSNKGLGRLQKLSFLVSVYRPSLIKLKDVLKLTLHRL